MVGVSGGYRSVVSGAGGPKGPIASDMDGSDCRVTAGGTEGNGGSSPDVRRDSGGDINPD